MRWTDGDTGRHLLNPTRCIVTGLPSLADDRFGVDALGGRPGVYSPLMPDRMHPTRTISPNCWGLKGVADAPTARFRTVMALRFRIRSVCADGWPKAYCGSVAGGGFGYDPVFLPSDGDGRTFAEMAPAEKNAISHRARALIAIVDKIREISGSGW